MSIPRKHWIWWGGAALLVLAALGAALIPARDWTASLEQALEERNLLEAMLVFGLAYVVGTLVMVPSWIFPIAAGAAFGMRWGLVGSVIASTLAALAAFLLARYVARDRLERAARKIETFAAVDKAVKREPRKVVALLRLSPVLPSGLKSYFLGLTCVGTLDYTLASAAGMLPGLALKVWLGDAGRDALSSASPLKWAIAAAGLAATIAIAWLVASLSAVHGLVRRLRTRP